MTRSGAKEKFWLGVLACALSALLWLQVSAQNQVRKEREFTVPIRYTGLSEELAILDEDQFVKVTLDGPASEVDRVDAEDVSPAIALNGRTAGEHRFRLNRPSLPAPITVRFSRNEVILRLEPIERARREVETEVVGIAPEGLRYQGATAAPSSVVITGPKSAMDAVRKVRVRIDLAALKPGVTQRLPVEVLGNNDTVIPGATADPSEVEVIPSIAELPQSTTALLVPKFEGQPLFGYRVIRYTLTPSTVQVSGEPSVLAALQTLETEAITIDRLRQSFRGTAKIVVPEGATVTPSEVAYEVVIVPVGRVP